MLIERLKSATKRVFFPRLVAKRIVENELAIGECEMHLLPILADPNSDFIDIGANMGPYGFYATAYFRRVLSVEAHPDLIKALRRGIGSKGEVLNAAISDKAGRAKLSIPVLSGQDVTTRSSLNHNANPGFDLREVDIKTITIDDLKLDKAGVIKIDIEGHELAAVKGAVQTIRKQFPIFIIECEERHNAGGVLVLFDFMRSFGYAPFFIHRNTLKHGSEFRPDVHQDISAAKAVGSAKPEDYINNFIFLDEIKHAKQLNLVRERYRS